MVSAEVLVILVVHFLVPECMKFYTVAVVGGGQYFIVHRFSHYPWPNDTSHQTV